MDKHCMAILNEFKEKRVYFEQIESIVTDILDYHVAKEGIEYARITSRIKTADSLAGKLELKGYKYQALSDITDLLGARVSTLYSDEIDLVAALIERLFNIDWDNSVDKRTLLESDRFGYMSIHYICTIPKELYFDDNHQEINEIKFEIQIRTVLQDIWATINHDLGYKSAVEIPVEYKRTISRLAGLLELADDEFKRFRLELSEYRKKVLVMVKDGQYEDISYSKDSFDEYMSMDPFGRLNESIASSLKADIVPGNILPYYKVFSDMGFRTIGDIEAMKNKYFDDAKRFALHRIAGMKLDIIASTVGIINLCIVYLLKDGYGKNGLRRLIVEIYGEVPDLDSRVDKLIGEARDTNII